MDQIYIGVDVAKTWLDIYHPARGAKLSKTHRSAFEGFARAVAREGDWVIFEASGGYDRALRDGIEAAHANFSRVNPRQARIARSGGNGPCASISARGRCDCVRNAHGRTARNRND
jgi:transposase